MGDGDHGHSVASQRFHNLQHLAHHLGVKRRGRLVKQHDLRVHAKGTHDGYSLLLAARELAGVSVSTVAESHLIEQRQRLLACRLAGFPQQLHGSNGHIAQDCHMGEQIKVLEHHAHTATVHIDVRTPCEDVFTLHIDLAPRGDLQKVQRAKQGGFTAARGADDDHHLAVVDAKIHTVQRLDGGSSVILFQSAHADHFITVHFCATSSPARQPTRSAPPP